MRILKDNISLKSNMEEIATEVVTIVRRRSSSTCSDLILSVELGHSSDVSANQREPSTKTHFHECRLGKFLLI